MPTSGSYQRVDGRPVVRFERTFPHPVAEVWDAVTDPARLAQWFPTSVEFGSLQAGAPIVFRFAEDRYPSMSGAIVEVSPPERLVFTWGDDELTFELVEAEGGSACRLAFSVVLDAADKAARDAAGWEDCLDNLAELTDGQVPSRSSSRDRWQRHYDEYIQLGFPATAAIPE
jgi:uncharacterized protein YndB with AHSA1/START domain